MYVHLCMCICECATSMCVCMCICEICLCVCVCVCICELVSVCASVCSCLGVCTCISVYPCLCMCTCVSYVYASLYGLRCAAFRYLLRRILPSSAPFRSARTGSRAKLGEKLQFYLKNLLKVVSSLLVLLLPQPRLCRRFVSWEKKRVFMEKLGE